MTRCFYCKKKIKSVIVIKCDCDHMFCVKHMNRHSHNCEKININKTISKNNIRKNNPKIIIEKIDKI